MAERAPSAMFLIAARSVLAAAILVPNSLTLLNHAYSDPKARGRAVGFWAAGASVALTAGPFQLHHAEAEARGGKRQRRRERRTG
jgi:MFS family permease